MGIQIPRVKCHCRIGLFHRMLPFTVAFLVALASAPATRLWLAWRHARHVGAKRDKVPVEFAAHITLEAHQKAADYTVAKTRLSMAETLVAAALVLVLTLGGALEALSLAWAGGLEAGGSAHGIALICSVALIAAALGLPFDLYRTFVIEARFGFNRMTPALFL